MAGTAVCDDGIVIDLSAMRAVSVDPVARTALEQGGALWPTMPPVVARPCACVSWSTSPHTLQPYRAGVYLNFLDSDDDSGRVREAYGEQIYRRLADVKAKYDPDNAFHHNKNIQPG